MYPKTAVGKVIGIGCAIFGVLLISMPVGLLSAKFYEIYILNNLKKKVIDIYNKNLLT
jgi:ABC-type phosphate transport system permease subunit